MIRGDALANQQRDGQDRATRAVALLRKAGYRVDADAAFDPSLASDTAAARDRPPRVEPDVALAEHPQLGVVAATADGSSTLGTRRILEEHGWRHNPSLDIYTLPITTDRRDSLGKVAQTTVSMNRADLLVAVQPLLAQDVTARRSPVPTTAARHERSRLHHPQVPHQRRRARRQSRPASACPVRPRFPHPAPPLRRPAR
ncbi:hypothetical protein [Streptomyces sp. ISL-1]|uniref:hypothetical protein n=1 Tax=Streptomyces sp. ISL-1 TaxID=2817657 RepID=UPI0020357881|nr:hypothetical protein [Streptomyces sp. ISL-1]